MVHRLCGRQAVSVPPRILVVDLDGTLVLDNSFHAFLRSGWKWGGGALRLSILRASFSRAVGRSGRVEMKRRILGTFGNLPESRRQVIIDATVEMVMPVMSAPVVKLVREWQLTSDPIVLATAAPEVYASVLAERLGISDCLGTLLPVGGQFCELMGENKQRALEKWLVSKRLDRSGARLVIVSDSADDLPLMKSADEVHIQSSKAALQRIEGQLPAHLSRNHIDTEGPQPEGGIWLWFDDKPLGPLSVYEVRIVLSKHRYCLVYEGASHWTRLSPGESLGRAVRRVECPPPPATAQRVLLLMKRRVVRDKLGIFH